ncbi:FAD-binding protein [Conexibacter sp. W3-3-2]|uniref:NAD(P)/FAD-dependent oxidoreductase n=1 Tax=Paraconexibacter algicola TaxID=2133960 RepID=A0A2T4UG74_9ACTN|nr:MULTISPECIES: NAD(P)/FAD-dependent oxidoreductase [Solirubrobacterales]MTD44454.1 FAD-binding protein [Conexibacter sp. W3-3-2]PTL58215.1 NAD(P)/FAD-dependent oxidoreductase [Paraconexibacter algicola]
MDQDWDVIVVGAGAAGLNAAQMLGRARRRTLVVDAGEQSNRAAPAVHGVLGHDGRTADELYALGRRELATYPSVTVRDGTVTAARATGTPQAPAFTATVDGDEHRSRRLLLAGGTTYVLPDVPGAAELWGTDVFHCPFCHGWEVRDAPLALLAPGGGHLLHDLLLTGWSDDVVVLTDGPATALDDAARATLDAAGVRLEERPIARLRAEGGTLAAVVLADGEELVRRAVLSVHTRRQRSPLAEQLGLELRPDGTILTDGQAMTSLPGVLAAGDAAMSMPSVPNAIAEGSRAGAFASTGLLAEDHGLPFPPH